MNKCSCCGTENEKVKIYRLPAIGYGSAFDTLEDDDIVYFNLCPQCAIKINKWIKKKYPDLDLEEFWKCNIIKMDQHMVPFEGEGMAYFEEFQYEDILKEVFLKFMPEAYYYDGWGKTLKGRLHKFIHRFI